MIYLLEEDCTIRMTNPEFRIVGYTHSLSVANKWIKASPNMRRWKKVNEV